MPFNKRKRWYFKNNRSISIETAGWTSNPSIYLRVDGGERDITFHLGLGLSFYLTLTRFLPSSWYPTYESKYGYGKLGEERELSIAIHNGSFWWNFWVSEEWSSWTKNKTWRKGCFHFLDRIKGKHTYQRIPIDQREFVLPFFEGNYNVEVTKYERIDSYAHWPTSKMVSFEVKAGYYNEGKWIEKPIPVEGKGENSWDCDEDATYSSSFPGWPVNKQVNTCYEAALHFWHSMMKDRERRGSAKWIPKGYDRQLKTLK